MEPTTSGRPDDPRQNPFLAPSAPIGPTDRDGPHSRSPWLKPPLDHAAPYRVACRCGAEVGVQASQAGSVVRCGCGVDVTVPSLGRLRERIGHDRYESGPADTIQRMIVAGELPAGHDCALTGEPTDDVLDLSVLVPRFFRQSADDGRYGAAFGLLGALILAALEPVKIEEEGALTVPTPLRIALRNHERVRRMNQRRLKRLLRTVPVYKQLLEENPHAVVLLPPSRTPR